MEHQHGRHCVIVGRCRKVNMKRCAKLVSLKVSSHCIGDSIHMRLSVHVRFDLFAVAFSELDTIKSAWMQ